MHAQIWVNKRNEMLKAASDGRFIIESHPAGAIMGAKECFDAASAGTIDLAAGTPHTWIGKVPSSVLFSGRPLGLTAEQFAIWLDRYGGLEYMSEAFKDFNFGHIGYCFISSPEDAAWSNRKLDTLEAWEGVKFRSKGFWAEVLQDPRIGASVTTIAGGELYSALERGILDATEYSTPAVDIALGFYEVCKYLMVPGIHQPSTVHAEFVNKDSWEALPADFQAMFDSVTKAAAYQAYLDVLLKDGEALKFFEEYPGLEIVILPDKLQQQFLVVADDLYAQKCAADPFFAEVYQSQLDFLEVYGTYEHYMAIKF